MKLRIVVLFDSLGPYHVARLQACTRVFDLLAIENTRMSTEYAWTPSSDVPFERVTLRETLGDRTSLARDRLEQTLDSFRPIAIAVPGWAFWLAIAAIRWAATANIPVVVMSDSQEIDFQRVFWKEFVKKRMVRFFNAALVGGQPHEEYMVKLGMPREAISAGYDVVDNEYFATESEKARLCAKEWRVHLTVPDQYFLCSARFIPEKNHIRLLHAYRCYLDLDGVDPSSHEKWGLVLLGDGAQRAAIDGTISELGLSGRVHLAGFRQITELPTFYALASVLVLPSIKDTWGLVVNEAMASGLPVLVSERCGCATDLVENGRNGFVFDPYDVDALAALMGKIARGDCDRSAMGKASLEMISRWSPETFAAGLEKAVEAALATPPRKVGVLDRALLAALAHR